MCILLYTICILATYIHVLTIHVHTLAAYTTVHFLQIRPVRYRDHAHQGLPHAPGRHLRHRRHPLHQSLCGRSPLRGREIHQVSRGHLSMQDTLPGP